MTLDHESEEQAEKATAATNGVETGRGEATSTSAPADTTGAALRPRAEPESISSSAAEPQDVSEQLEPEVHTSAKHVAQLLAEDPVDH